MLRFNWSELVRIGEEFVQLDNAVSSKNDVRLQVLLMDLMDKLAASATGRKHRNPAFLVFPDGDDLADSELPSGHHRCYGAGLGAEPGSRRSIQAHPHIDIPLVRDQGTSHVSDKPVSYLSGIDDCRCPLD